MRTKEAAHERGRLHAEVPRELANGRERGWHDEQRLEEPPTLWRRLLQIALQPIEGTRLDTACTNPPHEVAEIAPASRLTHIDQPPHTTLAKCQQLLHHRPFRPGKQGQHRNAGVFAHDAVQDAGRHRAMLRKRHEKSVIRTLPQRPEHLLIMRRVMRMVDLLSRRLHPWPLIGIEESEQVQHLMILQGTNRDDAYGCQRVLRSLISSSLCRSRNAP